MDSFRALRVHQVDKQISAQIDTIGLDDLSDGEVTVQLEYQGSLFRGRGISTDSVEASAKAFLNAGRDHVRSRNAARSG